MIPVDDRLATSHGERKVFQALRDGLPGGWTVLHSVSWLQRRPGGAVSDGEADFVLVHPAHGALVMEVKGGEIRHDGATGEWFSRDQRGRTHAIKDPFRQCVGSKNALRRYLEDRPAWPRAWGPFGHAVWFPDVRWRGRPLPQIDPAIVLDASDLAPSRVEARIRSVCDFWRTADRAPDEMGARLLVQALAQDFEIRQPLASAVEDAERAILTLSERQYGVLRTLAANRRVAVSGPAGSGKTLLAAEKARLLAGQGLRTLLTCFNRRLADHLRAGLRDVRGLDVLNYHQLCQRLARRAGLALPVRGDEAAFDEWSQVLEQAALRIEPCYDAIIADEAQDFGESWWLPLLTLLPDPDRDVFYAFYDSNQALYSRPAGLPGGCVPASLFESWRNTRPIFDAVMRYYRGEEEVECVGPDGPTVELRRAPRFRPQAELGRVLHRLIVAGQLSPADVVVLTPWNVERSRAAGRYGSLQVTPNPAGANDVRLTSVYQFKGLESKAVIVCELDERAPNHNELMYVACSRARSLLVVIASE